MGAALALRLVLGAFACVAALALLPGIDPSPELRRMLLVGCAWVLANSLVPLGAIFKARMDMGIPVAANAAGGAAYVALAWIAVAAFGRAEPVFAALAITSAGSVLWIARRGATRLRPRLSGALPVVR